MTGWHYPIRWAFITKQKISTYWDGKIDSMYSHLDLQSKKNDSKVGNSIESNIPAYWETYITLSFSHYFGDIIKSFSNKVGNN